jgi:hypothetical protein
MAAKLGATNGQLRSFFAGQAAGENVRVLRRMEARTEPTVQEVLAMDSQASLEVLQLLCRLIGHRLREIHEEVIGWRIPAGEPGANETSRTAQEPWRPAPSAPAPAAFAGSGSLSSRTSRST